LKTENRVEAKFVAGTGFACPFCLHTDQ
jgi:hypothetical protein